MSNATRITSLEKELARANDQLNKLHIRLYRLENPPKYKIGDKVYVNYGWWEGRYDYLEREIVGIDPDLNSVRKYYLRNEGGLVSLMSESDIAECMRDYKGRETSK